MRSIKIKNIIYAIVDTKEKMTVADSFVKSQNKIMTGNGEAKFYLGNNKEARNFFGKKGFRLKCFLLKKDLLQYMKEAEAEYKNPEQHYRHKEQMPTYWLQRIEAINKLDNILWFTLSEQTQIDGARMYAKSSDQAFDIIRELSLPFITYLSAIKAKAANGEIVYYFRLFVDYFGESQHPFAVKKEQERIADEIQITDKKKKEINYARVGQGKYRKEVLEECPYCPITMVTDDRLLIASHIKPWVASEEKEKLDPKNGFMFTPTYDFLFDRGFITFTDKKKMKVSPWLSKMTCSKLSIADDKKYPMLPVEGREKYLNYHRTNIFKS